MLPYDVLYLIFIMCWREAHRRDRRKHWPFDGSHVCRLWRSYIIDTPAFWTHIAIRGRRPQLDKYRIWLTRLKGSPFDLYIGWDPFESSSIKTAKSIMRMLMPHVSHLRTLAIDCVPMKIIRLIFDRLDSTDMPLLQVLRVSRQRSGNERLAEDGEIKLKFKPFRHGQAPRLSEVFLHGLPHQHVLSRFGESVKTFRDDPYSDGRGPLQYAKYVQNAITQAPNLTRFGISVGSGRFVWEDGHSEWADRQVLAGPPLVCTSHQALDEISISGDQQTRDIIMCSLNLPKLRFILGSNRGEATLGLACLQSIALGPFPSLISLRLGGSRDYVIESSPRDLNNCLNLKNLRDALTGLPQLRALTFDRVDFEDGGYLDRSFKLSACCPRLQWLTLFHCAGWSMQELRDLVTIRKSLENMDSLVRVIVITWPPRVPGNNYQAEDEAEDWLRRAVEFRTKTTSKDESSNWSYLSVVEGIREMR
ncbi:hypothetical protein FRB90_002221 [Tulasnella sp. 427]|nr:hypothetical protein FRB90_002221 [Tulasnella sp. 427]